MRWGGVIIGGFVVYHLLHLTFGTAHPDFEARVRYHNVVTGFRSWPCRWSTCWCMIPLGLHIYPRAVERDPDAGHRESRGQEMAPPRRRGRGHRRRRSATSRYPLAVLAGWIVKLGLGGQGRGTEREDPRPARSKKWDRHRFDLKLINPANKRKFDVIVVGSGWPARRPRRRWPSWATTSLLHLPRQPAPRAQHRGPGRDQRRQELPERRRQHLPAVLRHGQGRRLPLARGQRLPAGRGQRQHHRPVRGPGRAVRPRVRRDCWPTARSAAPRSRGRSTPAARPASSCCSAPTRRWSARSRRARCDVPRTRCST